MLKKFRYNFLIKNINTTAKHHAQECRVASLTELVIKQYLTVS